MFFTPAAPSNPFRDLERLFEELHAHRGAPRFAQRSGEVPLNLWANEHGLVLTAEVPGVDPASIGVSVVGDTVSITGKRLIGDGHAKDPHQPPQELAFTRTVQLPFRVDADRTEARCSDGVLNVTLHRPEAERPRTISVTAA